MIYRGNRTTSTPHSTFSPLFHLDPLVDWRRRLTILVSPSLPVDLWLCLHSHWTPYHHFLLLFCVAAVGRSVISGRQLLHCNFAFPLLSLYSYFFINILFAYAFNDVSDCLQCRPSDGFICSRILLYLFLYWLHFYHQYLLRITNQLECGGRWVDCIQARLSFFVPQTHTHIHIYNPHQISYFVAICLAWFQSMVSTQTHSSNPPTLNPCGWPRLISDETNLSTLWMVQPIKSPDRWLPMIRSQSSLYIFYIYSLYLSILHLRYLLPRWLQCRPP